jgi:hypothetical protein
VIGDRLQELNRDWLARGLPVVQMRVGIFTGPVMVGSLGGKERLEYGVIGDSVNIASRLESCEKDRQTSLCRILIAQETLVHIEGQFQVESWGSLELKGRQHKVEVYRVVGRMPESQSISVESCLENRASGLGRRGKRFSVFGVCEVHGGLTCNLECLRPSLKKLSEVFIKKN